jgi:four helix bundle protein
MCADWDLRTQLASASAAVPANVAEGFGQQTDRQFVRYLYIARGSAQEVRAHLAVARGRGYIDEIENLELSGRYEEIAKMLTGLIEYLQASDRKYRG